MKKLATKITKVTKKIYNESSCSSWLISLLILFAVSTVNAKQASPASEIENRFALLVGIEEYKHAERLNGCVQDVADMKRVLVTRFGFQEENILTLINEQATGDAIIKAFRKHLIENARKRPGALAVFHYSGHGSQVPDANGDEADGFDETLVAVDGRDCVKTDPKTGDCIEGKHFDLLDDEFDALFEELSRYTSHTVFILDSCHSGTATRGEDFAKTRRVPIDKRQNQPLQKEIRRTRSESLRNDSKIDLLTRSEKYVAISSCKSSELAHERVTRLETGKRRHNGALTYYLVRALERATPETTYRELMERVANELTSEFPNQHPQIEGNIAGDAFAGSASGEDYFIGVESVKGKSVTIKAGAAQGIKEGTIIAIYKPEARRLIGEKEKLASAVVDKVGPFASTAQLTSEAVVPLNAKAVPISPNLGNDPLSVMLKAPTVGGDDPGAKLLDATIQRLAESGLVKPVEETGDGEGRKWDLAVLRGKFGDVFNADSVAPSPTTRNVAASPNADVFYLAAGDGLPLFGFYAAVEDPDGARKLSDAVLKAAKQRNLKALCNDVSPLNKKIKVSVIRVHGRRNDEGKFAVEREEPLPDQINYVFEEGAVFRFEIENDSEQDLYISAIDLGTDGSIQIFYPPINAREVLGKKRRFKTPLLRITEPTGIETFIIVAATKPVDFHPLIQTAADGGERRDEKTPQSPLDMVFHQAMTGKRAAVEEVEVNVDDWTVVRINFAIYKPTKRRQ